MYSTFLIIIVPSAANQPRMNSEGSYDSEALHDRNELHFNINYKNTILLRFKQLKWKAVVLYCNNISQYYCIFKQ